ncbi:MAG: class I SAM-dependent methyltransferase [bacterium]
MLKLSLINNSLLFSKKTAKTIPTLKDNALIKKSEFQPISHKNLYPPSYYITNFGARKEPEIIMDIINGKEDIGYTISPSNTMFAYTNRGINTFLEFGIDANLLNLQELKGKNVLDIGTGGGLFVSDLKNNGVKAKGIDYYLNPEQRSQPDTFYKGSSEELPFDNNTFDYVYSAFSIFSFEKDKEIILNSLSEIVRTLKKGGKLRLIVPNENTLRLIIDK